MMVLLWPGMEELVSLLRLVPISPLGRGALKDFPFSILTFYTVRSFLTIHIHTYVHIYVYICIYINLVMWFLKTIPLYFLTIILK